MAYRFLPSIFAFCAFCATALAAVPPDTSAHSVEVFPHRILVKLDSTSRSPVDDARSRLAPYGAQFGIGAISSWLNPTLLSFNPHPALKLAHGAGEIDARFRALGRIVIVEYTSPYAPAYVAAKLGRLAGIEYAEPVFKRKLDFVPNDPLFAQESAYLEQIRAIEGWDLARADSNVVIGIVDTGVDLTHPDLSAALWHNAGEMGLDKQGRDRRTNGVDDDGNGVVDDWVGYDFGGGNGYTPDNDPSPGYSHGTHVAGIAGASGNNGIGVIGVAFGAKLMAVKISDDNPDNPTLTAGFSGIIYAAKMGANIINCSWGGPGRSQAEQDVIDAVSASGSLVVAAAGNEATLLPSFPAAYRNVLAVASVSTADQRSTFSNFNASIGISAPGELIYSTVPRSLTPDGYKAESGTSMASPLVAGAAALVISKFPDLAPEQVSAVLRASAADISASNPSYPGLLGSGRLDLQRALTAGPDAVFAEVIDHQVMEDDPDGIIAAGETIELRVTVENFLRQTEGLSAELSTVDPIALHIDSPQQTFGVLGPQESRETSPGVFRFTVPSWVPVDYTLPMLVTLREQGRIIGTQRVDVLVNPNFATTAANKITATFTGNGRIGYADFPINLLGRGFRVDSAASLLAEGGVIIGVSPARLADVVRNGDNLQNSWLETVQPYRVQRSQTDGTEIGTARFDDAHLIDLQRVGVDIRLKTYEYTGLDQENQLLAFYTITNTSQATLDNLFCGLFLDWDIGPNGASNQIDFDPENRMGYIANVVNPAYPVVGSVLVSNQQMNFTGLENDAPPMIDGFSQHEKWEALSSGIHHESTLVTDCSMVIGAGPLTLAPGADTTVVFAFLVGDNLTELKNEAKDARTLAGSLGSSIGEPIPLPSRLNLLDLGPNPFQERARIQFWMPEEGEATLTVYNAIGQNVATLADGVFNRGIHTIDFVPEEGSNGIFFVQFHAFGETYVQKLLRVLPR